MRGCSFVGRPASLPVITKFVAIKGGGSFDRNVGVPTLQRHRVWAVTMYHLRVVEGDYSSNHCSKQGPIPLVRIRPLRTETARQLLRSGQPRASSNVNLLDDVNVCLVPVVRLLLRPSQGPDLPPVVLLLVRPPRGGG